MLAVRGQSFPKENCFPSHLVVCSERTILAPASGGEPDENNTAARYDSLNVPETKNVTNT